MNMEGVMLKDEELEMVSGGAVGAHLRDEQADAPVQTKKLTCPNCGPNTDFYIFSGGRCVCSKCSFELFK
ncbi:MAG: hypothetical protein K6G58_10390 [Lachnospiraceae bacterium]|nr:hypothetical protein [Lachnospiraceae bacterium]